MKRGTQSRGFSRQQNIIYGIFFIIFVQATCLIIYAHYSVDNSSSIAQESLKSNDDVSMPPPEVKKVSEDVPKSAVKRGPPGLSYNYFRFSPTIRWCSSEQVFDKAVSLDPKNRFVEPTKISQSPFRNCSSGIDFNKVYVPGRVWSKKIDARIYGGLTADMGWILLVSRLALHEGVAVEFPPYWGHGCPDSEPEEGWKCFFEPINRGCLSDVKKDVKILVQEDRDDRHHAKLLNLYNNEDLYHKRNQNALKYFSSDFAHKLQKDNDVQVMRQLFHWVFTLKPIIRSKVDKKKEIIISKFNLDTQEYISVHLRGGDKIGKNRDGPVEARAIPMEAYVKVINCKANFYGGHFPKLIFVATDDIDLLNEFKTLLGNEYKVVTSADESAEGFGLKQYRDASNFNSEEKFNKAINLWTDMEVLRDGKFFVSCMQSNVARMLHIMRYGKLPNTTLRVPFSSSRTETCCSKDTGESRLKNCYWLCT